MDRRALETLDAPSLHAILDAREAIYRSWYAKGRISREVLAAYLEALGGIRAILPLRIAQDV